MIVYTKTCKILLKKHTTRRSIYMEIERKFLIKQIPEGCTSFPCRQIEQAYLNTDPVVRVRRDNDDYYLTYKGKGLLAREEYHLPLTKESYEHLLKKADGLVLTKVRWLLPLEGRTDLTIELDIFSGCYKGLILAEVEFPTIEDADSFTPPDWFGEDVTFSGLYQNSRLSNPHKQP